MTAPCRVVPVGGDAKDDEGKEFLVANGLGGFSSATILGTLSRRYHGVLVAALPAPFGRTVMLNQIDEVIEGPNGVTTALQGEEGDVHLDEFRLELGLPVWTYR